MNVVIIGAGGHGKVVLDILHYDSNTKVVGFIDDDQRRQNQAVSGVPVLGNFGSLPQLIQNYAVEGAIVAIGDNKIRADFFAKLKERKLKLTNAIHPSTVISKNVELGEGVVIATGAVINTDTRIGNNVVINTGAIIDHDNVIEDHVHIAPGASLAGSVKVKRYAHIGIGASVVPGVIVGGNATVGAGAAVIEDVPDNAVVGGVPARVIKYKEKGD